MFAPLVSHCREAIDQVKLLSIGKPIIATPGIKLDIKENEEKQ